MRRLGIMPLRWAGALIFSLSICPVTLAIADPPVRVSESGEVLQMEYEVNGRSYRDTIPLYRTGPVRYFSTGVGIEERSASYPPFPLKLIFTAGGKPYVAGVSVTVQRIDGPIVASIPQEHVTGPWLFLDLPDGAYHIAATVEGQTERLKDVRIEQGTQKILHMRWSEDRGQSREAEAE